GVGAVGVGDSLDGDGARYVTACVAAHPVGDNEEVFSGVGGILVVGAYLADVGEGGAFSGAGHPVTAAARDWWCRCGRLRRGRRGWGRSRVCRWGSSRWWSRGLG